MKRTILTAAVSLLALASGFGCARAHTDAYARHGHVTHIDPDRDAVEFTDSMGFTWEFYGVEDWLIGDGVNAVMCDMGTDAITDDEIVNVRYDCD